LSTRLDRRRLAILLAAVAVFSGALIAASLAASRGESAPAVSAPAGPAQESSFTGIPQQGAALGDPNAEVTLVEYADLQCPYCAQWSRQALPVLVDEYVRTGRVRIVFRGLAFLGPDSVRALRAAVAAGRQNRLWNVVEGLYSRQGAENSGWVSDAMLHEVAGHRAVDGSSAPWIDRELTKSSKAAQAAGIAGTPAFQVGRTGGPLELVQVSSLGAEGLRPAIESALAE
jgi:protein-disulfide isomerase